MLQSLARALVIVVVSVSAGAGVRSADAAERIADVRRAGAAERVVAREADPPPQQRAPIVQPGAPGESTKVITPEQATDLARVRHTDADVAFMQGMIAHHAQALEMTALAAGRTTNAQMQLLMKRLDLSQADEITFMQSWLQARGAAVPDPHAAHAGHTTLMPGMLTGQDMARLRVARGTAFDRLFLEFMIKHHDGALVMVEQLFNTAGAGQESEIFAFASDVVDDQRAEIARMAVMLKELQK